MGERGQERIQTLDARKSYLIDDAHQIGTRAKTLVICTSYNTEPELMITNLLNSTQHMLAYYKKPKVKKPKKK